MRKRARRKFHFSFDLFRSVLRGNMKAFDGTENRDAFHAPPITD